MRGNTHRVSPHKSEPIGKKAYDCTQVCNLANGRIGLFQWAYWRSLPSGERYSARASNIVQAKYNRPIVADALGRVIYNSTIL